MATHRTITAALATGVLVASGAAASQVRTESVSTPVPVRSVVATPDPMLAAAVTPNKLFSAALSYLGSAGGAVDTAAPASVDTAAPASDGSAARRAESPTGAATSNPSLFFAPADLSASVTPSSGGSSAFAPA